MGIGGSILLIVVGAILTFGVKNQDLGPLNLHIIGWILQLAGLLGLILTLYFWNSRRTRVVAAPPSSPTGPPPPIGTVNPPAPGDQVVEQRYTERRNY
jgi:hypothetical protein